MVLCLKARESRSPPGLPTYQYKQNRPKTQHAKKGGFVVSITHAGWSSPVARQAHNLKAARSNRAPATTDSIPPDTLGVWGFLFVWASAVLPDGEGAARFKIIARSPCSSIANR